MVNSCVAQLKKNKEEQKEIRKPSESLISFPIITSKLMIGEEANL